MTFALSRRMFVLSAIALACLGTAARAQAVLSPAALTGIWQGVEQVGGYTITGEVIFYGNGTYRRMHTLGQLRTWQTGDYSIAENWLHFQPTDYEPKYYQNVYQPPPPSETWMIDYFDGRTIEGRIGTGSVIHFEKVN